MAAHQHHGADTVFKASGPAGQRGHEHHADDRRAARAPRHLHGRPAAQPARPRRQPAGRNAAQPNSRQPDVSQIVLNYTADRKISINNQDVTIDELEERLRTIFEERKEKTMFIMGAGHAALRRHRRRHRRRQGRRRREGRHRHRRHAPRGSGQANDLAEVPSPRSSDPESQIRRLGSGFGVWALSSAF